MTYYPTMKTGGGTVEMAPETALGTPDAYVHQRLTATDPTFPTNTREALDVPFTGHRHWGTRENQVTFERYQEGSLTIPTYVTRGTSGAATVPCQTMQHLLAAGANVGYTTESAVAIATSVDSFTITPDASTDAGCAGLLGIGSGDSPSYYLPVLPSAFSTPTVTPSMELPAATKAGYLWGVMSTATPRVGPLAATSTNAFRAINYYMHTAAQSQFTYTGCAVQQFADVVFEPGKPLEIVPTYHVGDISGPDTGTAATEVFQDLAKPCIISGDGECHVNLGTFADPVTTNVRATLVRANWTLGIGCVVKPGFGASTNLNGIGTYLSMYTGSKITIEVEMNKSWWANWIARSASTDVYLAITQPVTNYLTGTAAGLWMPRCKIYGSPKVELFGEDALTATITLEPTCPAYEADESVTSLGMAPWYFAISGQGA